MIHRNETGCTVTQSEITGDILCRVPGPECDCLMSRPDESYADAAADDRAEFVSARVTLNGRPAAISGARNQFATVATLTGAESAEWSWATVARIVAAGGDFRA